MDELAARVPACIYINKHGGDKLWFYITKYDTGWEGWYICPSDMLPCGNGSTLRELLESVLSQIEEMIESGEYVIDENGGNRTDAKRNLLEHELRHLDMNREKIIKELEDLK